MDINLSTGLILVGILSILKLLITLAYSALINTRKSMLRERIENGDKRAKHTLEIAEDATTLLATYQYLSLFFQIGIATLLILGLQADIGRFLDNVGMRGVAIQVLSLFVILIALNILLIVFGERMPTALASKNAENLAIFVTPLMGGLIAALKPMNWLTLNLSKRLAALMGAPLAMHMVTEEEIKTLVDAGSEGGVLEDEEKEMIYSIIRFGDTVAREVMVPRIDIVALELGCTLEEALQTIIEHGHSRIPVYRNTIDDIVGILYAKDLLKLWLRGEKPKTLEPVLREPYFVPESKKASDLLVELQQKNMHIVIVMDEYGGTAGIATMEDLVEEIVGEIRDEYDVNEEALFEKLSDEEYIFNARIDLDHMNYLLDTAISTEESDTLGGFIFTELGRVPSIGDVINTHNLEIKVLSVEGRRIQKVHIQKIVEEEELEEAETTEDVVEVKPDALVPSKEPTKGSSDQENDDKDIPSLKNNSNTNSSTSAATASTAT